ncbi:MULTISPECIES: cadherin-like domain-containing protein [Trichocoleus]|uniref:Cadherin-like domain-containing protein n=1 Tax=Trichocoleus desertorum GB2-A4 TaxID=2933944 RepID=A0ABV0J6P0_9CYAN|nr:cadherin-like domain-containing protein [Trichocoleus sp. FACHB-46]MBD1863560.1 cadherin-like domain-containing protein [Trichocoleus sp. FACHB-46]
MSIDISTLFDERFYLVTYTDVAAAVAQGFFASGSEHFRQFGQREQRNPSPLFDNQFYLQNYPDVAAAVAQGAFPSGLDHFLQFGQSEQRNPSSLFDSNFYLATYTDVAAAVAQGVLSSGFEHFLRYGRFEQRNPSSLFNESFYLAHNSDVAGAVAAGAFISGFDHFSRYGRLEGRDSINTAPLANSDAVVTTANTATAINVLGNDSDKNQDVLALTGFSSAANGTVTKNSDGTLTYAPNANFSGVDTFTYTIEDGYGGTATGTVAITVNPAPSVTPTNGYYGYTTGKFPNLSESSGLVRGAGDFWWTHNDSGNTAAIYAIDNRGKAISQVNLPGATNVDWEEITAGSAPGGGKYLFIGDIGNNQNLSVGSRTNQKIYVVNEPSSSAQSVSLVATLPIRYPSGSFDSEAMVFDSDRQELLIITKDLFPTTGQSKIFSRTLSPNSPTLTLVGTFDVSQRTTLSDRLVTGAALSSDRTTFILRTYNTAFLWQRTPGESWSSLFGRQPNMEIPLPNETQGEAIAFGESNTEFYTTSEQTGLFSRYAYLAIYTGTANNDVIVGDTAANVIAGEAGGDRLTGGGGADIFLYKAPNHGRDSITDFASDDTFHISEAGFGGGLRAGIPLSTTTASTGVLVSSAAPTSLGTSANFLYNTSTGVLSFDADGTGAGSAVAIATLTNTPILNVNQFVVTY